MTFGLQNLLVFAAVANALVLHVESPPLNLKRVELVDVIAHKFEEALSAEAGEIHMVDFVIRARAQPAGNRCGI